MDINWISWLFLLIVVVFFSLLRWMSGPLFQRPESYMEAYTAGAWAMWVLYVLMEVVMLRAQKFLERDFGLNNIAALKHTVEHMGRHSDGAHAPKRPPRRPMSNEMIFVLEQLLQVLTVATGALWALYMMHIIFNIRFYHLSRFWHVVFLLPLILNLFVHLPAILGRYSA